MALGFEGEIIHLVGPCGCGHGLAQHRVWPGGVSGVRAVSVEERADEVIAAPPLLGGKSAQIGGCGAQIESSEVDHMQRAVVNQLVSRLPVAVGGNQHDRRRGSLTQEFANPGDDGRLNAVGTTEPAECPFIGCRFCARVEFAVLVVEFGQCSAGLVVEAEVEFVPRVLGQLSGKVVKDEDVQLIVCLLHSLGEPAAQQGSSPSAVGLDLPTNVAV